MLLNETQKKSKITKTYSFTKKKLAVLIVGIVLAVGIVQTLPSYLLIKHETKQNKEVYVQEVFENNISEDYFYLQEFPVDLRGVVFSCHEMLGIPVKYIYRVAYVESGVGRNKNHKKNKNGSLDYGMMGLNSVNLEWFEKEFFNSDMKFDPNNDTHNLVVGCSFLKYLYNKYNDWEIVIMSYNTGEGNVMAGKIPEITRAYAKAVVYKEEYLDKETKRPLLWIKDMR